MCTSGRRAALQRDQLPLRFHIKSNNYFARLSELCKGSLQHSLSIALWGIQPQDGQVVSGSPALGTRRYLHEPAVHGRL